MESRCVCLVECFFSSMVEFAGLRCFDVFLWYSLVVWNWMCLVDFVAALKMLDMLVAVVAKFWCEAAALGIWGDVCGGCF